MKKKVFAVILAAAAICGSLSPVYAADSELVLYTWEGMFPQEVCRTIRSVLPGSQTAGHSAH